MIDEKQKSSLLEKVTKIITPKLILGILIGGALGYAYYYFVGCNSGSCAITSSPTNSTLYGMLFGGILLWDKPKKKEDEEEKQETENN